MELVFFLARYYVFLLHGIDIIQRFIVRHSTQQTYNKALFQIILILFVY